jgi:glycosyltransferase involved in cell wall biosynthesis
VRILLTADPTIPVPPVGYGGIERIVAALARAYQEQGHSVGLVAHAASQAKVEALYGWPSTEPALLRNGLALRQAVRDFRADVLHSFSRLAYMLPLLPTRLPKVMSYQRHTGGATVAWASRLAGRSLRFTGCSDFICSMGRPAGGQWRAIPNFVELEKFDFRSEVLADAPLVFLSRIETIKGADLAIAIAKASGHRLILAGGHGTTGAELAYWNEQVAPRLSPGTVEWVGEVDDRQKNLLLGQAAALLVPVQWDEPFGIVFAEALACGTPVISCPRGALTEIVEEGRTGFLVRTVAEGRSAVQRLHSIARSDCRQAAEGRFSVGPCSERYLELYREMIGTDQR